MPPLINERRHYYFYGIFVVLSATGLYRVPYRLKAGIGLLPMLD